MKRVSSSTAAPVFCLVLAIVLGGCGSGAPAVPVDLDVDETLDLSAAFLAKSLCSGLWVNGREREEFLANDILFGREQLEAIELVDDEQAHAVTSSIGGKILYRAVFNAGHGCTILPANIAGVAFDPVSIEPAPTATALASDPFENPGLTEPERAAFDDAARLAFVDVPGVRTRAIVALHHGRLIAERYDPDGGFGPESVNISWSMGKSIASALVGTVVQHGWLNVDDPAPIAAWHERDDPRAEITVPDLLQMSSGLAFDRIEANEAAFFSADNHHFMVYFGVQNTADYVTGFPLRSPPGTVGIYRNSDPLSLVAIVRDLVEAHGEDFLTYPQRALFDRISATSYVLERDTQGNPIISGYDHATARDWARFGLLHLNDGVWNGDRILPAGWSDTISARAPGWESSGGGYGGLFWRNDAGSPGGRFPSVPDSANAYYAAGAFGQFTIVIPEHDLVVVRMGYDSNGGAAAQALDRALAAILEQIALLERVAA